MSEDVGSRGWSMSTGWRKKRLPSCEIFCHPERSEGSAFSQPCASQDDRAALAANVGGRRALDACSYAYASFNNVGSLHARPMNDNPTGSPCTSPIGTVMCG